MLLSNLGNFINIKKTYNFKKNKNFSSITANSKLTDKKTLLMYDTNKKIKRIYVDEAIRNNIPAIVTNKYINNLKIPQFVVSNINLAINSLLKKIYTKSPYKTIAVTGTNGKTSVVWYISKILTLLNYNNSTVGTLGHFINGKKINEVSLTTPAYEELYKFGSLSKKGKYIYIFEASSHALEQNRLRDYTINVAAITNISNDHLDYHKTFSRYKKSKMKLFNNHLENQGFAIINSKLKNLSKLKINLIKKNVKLKYFGNKYFNFRKTKDSVYLIINKNKYKLNNLKLNTNIELENLECAIACCLALNISQNKIVKVLSKVDNPPGRLEIVEYKKKNSKIVIDYAHTPDALKKILYAYKVKNTKPSLLFGCGGERDKSKRKVMGLIANKYANRIYITDDNPRNENPSEIRKNILKYCPRASEISNRKKAIKVAINELKMNEILILAGKGHEKIQIVKNKQLKFDDLEVVKQFINK